MRIVLPLGSGAAAVIIEVTAAITSPGDVDAVALLVLCVVSFIVTAAAVGGVQWYERRRAEQERDDWPEQSLDRRISDLERDRYGYRDPGHHDERGSLR